jgi:hypothetical protein
MSGLNLLYKFLLKEAAKGSGKASGILSIGGDVRKLANKKFQSYVMTAKKQGVDLDKLSEQEIKYMLEMNKPKGPTLFGHPVIDATSPEGQGITKDLFNMLDRQSGKNVIKTDFGKPFAEEVGSVDGTIKYLKTMKPMDSMKEANKVLKGEGRYKSLSKADRKKIVDDESVTDHIFERDIKPDPEDFAHGGRTGSGLNYLLGEDDQNSRVPFKDGTKFNPKRRTILKGIGALATLPIIGKYFKWAKPLAKSSKVLTSVPIKNIDGMPLWFKPFVNKVIKEGDDVTKKFAEAERQIVHKTKLPDSQTDVLVTQDLGTGDVVVDIGMGKHGFKDGLHGQPVRLEYKAGEWIEPTHAENIKRGSRFEKTGKPTKTKDEFWVEEAEFTGGHPENVKFEDVSYEKFGEHGSNFDEVEKFATGKIKKKTAKESIKAERAHWTPEGDMASGGRVPMWLGGGLKAGKGLTREMLKFMTKGSSHGKSPAEMLKMMNPKQFEKLLKDRSMYNKFSPEAGIMAPDMIKNMIKKTKTDRTDMIEQLISSARSIKKGDDSIIAYKNKIIEEMVSKGMDRKTAEEFAETLSKSLMKDVGPKQAGPKITEQGLLELENIQKNLAMKDRKLNASGGRASLSAGGLAGMLGE